MRGAEQRRTERGKRDVRQHKRWGGASGETVRHNVYLSNVILEVV